MTVTLLDGGIGQELVARAGGQAGALWSTRVMMDRPGLLQGVHAGYFAAGADIATTNTYAIHRDRLAPEGLGHMFEPLHTAALAAARAARDVHGAGRIAGSIGPLAASYRPDLHPDHATAVPLYAEVLRMLVPAADLVLFETVASLSQARAACAAVEEVGADRPVWLSVTLDDEDGRLLRSGERVADLLPLLGEAPLDAVLANCSAPEVMPAALDLLARAGRPFGAYANGFSQTTKAFLADRAGGDTLAARRDMGPVLYADHAMGWVGQGATIIGGCCEVGPAHIAEIAARLRAEGLHD
jgi:homocysteine S-methyltransferase